MLPNDIVRKFPLVIELVVSKRKLTIVYTSEKKKGYVIFFFLRMAATFRLVKAGNCRGLIVLPLFLFKHSLFIKTL